MDAEAGLGRVARVTSTTQPAADHRDCRRQGRHRRRRRAQPAAQCRAIGCTGM